MGSFKQPASVTDDTGAACISCAGRRFRRSRLKWKDLSALLSLHYPVRCLSCSKRQTLPFSVARRAVPSSVQQARALQQEVALTLHAAATADDPSVGRLELPKGQPVTMPDLHGITLDHVAHLPPGDGENLAS